MNVRKLMARLNPPCRQIPIGEDRTRSARGSASMRKALEDAGKYKSSSRTNGRFEPGELGLGYPSSTRIERSAQTRGGFDPDSITPAIITGALAFIPPSMGRDIFCYLWWADGANCTRETLTFQLWDMLMREYASRAREYETAKLSLHIIETTQERWMGSCREELGKARKEAQRAKDRRWTGNLSGYMRIPPAVLSELEAPEHCVICNGLGTVGIQECTNCYGRGVMPHSDRSRADMIGTALSSYQQTWSGIYCWLLGQCIDLERKAADAMVHQLSG